MSNFRSLSRSGRDEMSRNSVGLPSMKTDRLWSGRGKVGLPRKKTGLKRNIKAEVWGPDPPSGKNSLSATITEAVSSLPR